MGFFGLVEKKACRLTRGKHISTPKCQLTLVQFFFLLTRQDFFLNPSVGVGGVAQVLANTNDRRHYPSSENTKTYSQHSQTPYVNNCWTFC